MTTIVLKDYLVSKINQLEDQKVLNQIKKIVDKQETVYQLSDFLKEKIEISRKQIENGEFYTQEEVDLEIEKWLNEK
jgi:predicted transcriptional regulator